LAADRSLATLQAFWNNEGAHATAKQPWLDWNEEIIKPMVTDMEPSEEIFCQESKIIFRNLKDSTKQGLDVLCARLSGMLSRGCIASEG